MRNHVVYQYKCDRAECNFSIYIGYTTCSLYERFKLHTQTGSIIQHLRVAYNIDRLPRRQLLDKTELIAMDRDKRCLVTLEALLIKEKKPSLNSQAEGRDWLLKISYVYCIFPIWNKPCAVNVFFCIIYSKIFTLGLILLLCNSNAEVRGTTMLLLVRVRHLLRHVIVGCARHLLTASEVEDQRHCTRPRVKLITS